MNGHSQRAGLWSVEGAGVLARRGGLVLLSSLADTGFLDRLLDLLTETADAGGDGLRFVQSVEEALQADGSWRSGQEAPQRPAVIAFGEAGAGLAVSVTGAAWVEITTIDRTQQIVAGQPAMLLRCLVGSQVMAVRGGLGGGREDDVPTDPFSRLDSGVVRAGGFAYRAGHPAVPGAPDSDGAARDAVLTAPEGGAPGAAERVAAAVVEAGEPAEPAEPAVPAEPAEPAEQAVPVAAAAEPETSESGVVGAGTAERVAALAGDVGQPFDSVLLLGEEELGTVAPRAPLPLAPDQRHESADLPQAPEILGVYCKNGHFDDPRARFCAVCGISMNQQTLVPRPGLRPPLGLLVLDGGAIFQLDTDYVLGREPTLDAAVAAGEARPLRVVDDSGTVSRVHAKIQLDGWQVLVADLGSANGTFIRLPDQPADQWLTPHVPMPLLPGSHVVMGAFGFQYESHRGR
jgi:FHA domain-containing protein